MRCSVCDATHDGQLTNVPFVRSRAFFEDPDQPHLLVCSDCVTFYGTEDALEDGEIENVATDWDD